jgi:hypothetical protein
MQIKSARVPRALSFSVITGLDPIAVPKNGADAV